MSFLDQMKLWGLIDFSLILIMTSYSKGSDNKTWAINVSSSIFAEYGSTVVIPCTFTYPPAHHTDKVQLYWKTLDKSSFNTYDNDKNAFAFHTNDTFVLEKYRGRTSLIGDKLKENCSLQIKNITESEGPIYLRVIAKGDNYSFRAYPVLFSLSGHRNISDIPNTYTPSTEPTTVPTTETTTITALETSKHNMYIAIFVPIIALLVIVLVTGCVCFMKHKRSKTFTREESGYYANFCRASSSEAKREISCQTHDNKKLPEPKADDEPVYLKATEDPVYINVEAPPGEMDHSMDQMDSVYANVDYSR